MFAIWLLPNQNDSEYLQKIINKLNLEFNLPRFLPHITIYGLIDFDLNKIKKIIQNSINESKPFIVYKKEIKESENIWKSLFINLEEKNENLCLIHNKLNKELMQLNNKFLPHISLAYGKLNRLEKMKIIERLKIKKEIKINRICILKFSNNVDQWEIVEIFKL